ncbi:hypothetical protein Lal_00037666 [Lupinus albus]|nr:hypothetical protein Lal_00037666 [Lupinus albus]
MEMLVSATQHGDSSLRERRPRFEPIVLTLEPFNGRFPRSNGGPEVDDGSTSCLDSFSLPWNPCGPKARRLTVLTPDTSNIVMDSVFIYTSQEEHYQPYYLWKFPGWV